MLPLGLIAVTVATVLLVAVATGDLEEPDAASAQRVALQWSGAELADAPRREGDGWEVEVRRADGSLVVSGPGSVRSVERERDGSIEVDVVTPGQTVAEVELDRQLRVVDIDEEDIGDE